MQNKIEEKWYDDHYQEIIKWNELIGKFCDLLPAIEYCVGNTNEDSIRYSPKDVGNYFPDTYSQRKECERFIKELEEKKYVAHGILEVKKHVWWPFFHRDWNMIMLAFENDGSRLVLIMDG